MRQLFVKIFVFVLAAVMLAFGAGLAIAFWLRPESAQGGRPGSPARRAPGEGNLLDRLRGIPGLGDGVTALEARIAEGDADAVAAAIRALSDRRGFDAYLFDASATPLTDDRPPAELRPLINAARDGGHLHELREGPLIYAAERVGGHDGGRALILGVVLDPRAAGAWMGLRLAVMQLSLVVLALGIVSYALARYLARPILALRQSVRQWSAGDLEHRVRRDLVQRRDEMGELARDFDAMAEHIAALLTNQRRLLQDISHELRSPLARQRVAIELARDVAGSVADAPLDRVARESERLDELVGELLTLTRLDDSSGSILPSAFALDEMVHKIVDDAAYEARDLDRVVRLTRCDACPYRGVPELLRRAIEKRGAQRRALHTRGRRSLRLARRGHRIHRARHGRECRVDSNQRSRPRPRSATHRTRQDIPAVLPHPNRP